MCVVLHNQRNPSGGLSHRRPTAQKPDHAHQPAAVRPAVLPSRSMAQGLVPLATCTSTTCLLLLGGEFSDCFCRSVSVCAVRSRECQLLESVPVLLALTGWLERDGIASCSVHSSVSRREGFRPALLGSVLFFPLCERAVFASCSSTFLGSRGSRFFRFRRHGSFFRHTSNTRPAGAVADFVPRRKWLRDCGSSGRHWLKIFGEKCPRWLRVLPRGGAAAALWWCAAVSDCRIRAVATTCYQDQLAAAGWKVL